jgi:hypothetical protein
MQRSYVHLAGPSSVARVTPGLARVSALPAYNAMPHHLRSPAQVRALRWAGLVGAYLLAMLILFRVPILSGFDLGFGDRADAMIEIAILEHWRNVFAGVATWNAPLYFHPHADTLGYNDGYLLHGVLYAGWRIGFDPFHAETLTNATLASLGFAACWFLFARVLRWGWGVALLAALLFAISNNTYVQSTHAQIRSLALLPLLAAWVILAFRAEMAGRHGRARAYAAAAAALVGVWLVTAFYFAWFTLFFGLVLLLCWGWQARRLNRDGVALLARHRATLAFAIVAVAVAAIPFLLVYLPKLRETGGHGFKIAYLVHPTDTFNIGTNNIVWSPLIAALRSGWALIGGDAERVFGGEHSSGFPLLFLALACSAARPILRSGGRGFGRAFVLAVAISWALTLRIGPVSPWIAVHYLVPGASGVRVVLRYQLFLVLPLLLVIGMAYRQRFATWLRTAPMLAGLAAALLVAEQLSLAPVAELSRNAQLATLEALPAPPVECRSFYVVAARPHEPLYRDAKLHALYPHNVDAMYLAQRWRIPTLNGFSTFNPPDWNFADAKASDYDARAADYVVAHRLTGVCRLDARSAHPWQKLS